MIAANKRLLKATLTEGVLQIQSNLIALYTDNLSAMGVQASLIAGFAFSAVQTEFNSDSTIHEDVLSFLYFICYTMCFVSALIVLSQSTIVVMFGPSKALKGDSTDSVKDASENMRQQQWMVLCIGGVSITALFVGAMIQTWVQLPYPLAIILTLLYLTSYTLLIVWGRGAYFLFHLDTDITTPGGTEMMDERGYMPVSQGGQSGINSFGGDQDPSKLKVKGAIWVRESLENGGNFYKRFAVLEKGCFDFYHKEQDFISHENPINKKPIKLWTYVLETDSRKFSKSVTSIQNSLKSALMGNDDFTVSDLMTSGYDLPHAAKHFKFALIPKVSSELATADIIELLAHDERSYKHWLRALSIVISAYDQHGRLSIEHTLRSGATEVETVVRAANVI